MKKLSLTVILTAMMVSVLYAQDVIVLSDATEIESKVLEIRENSIAYKKWDNKKGPTYYISSDKVFFIKYANGTKEVFNTSSSSTPAEKRASVDTAIFDNSRPFIKDARFQAYLTTGLYFGDDLCLDVPSFSLGVRLFDYGYVGVKTGILMDFMSGRRYFGGYYYEDHYYYQDLMYHLGFLRMPILLDFRGYYPINRKIHPYIEFSPGLEICLLEIGYFSFAYHLGVGFDISRFTFGVGFYSGWGQYNGYFKLGLCLRKMR